MNELAPKESGGEFLLYQTEDGRIRIETRMQEETVWLTQDQMAQLFGKAKSNMGLTTWSGEKPRKTDVEVAKNYLSEKELDVLNRIVTMYLEFAELQALNRKPMYMRDWISKLDDFLKLSDREILTNAGTVSHEQALARVCEIVSLDLSACGHAQAGMDGDRQPWKGMNT